MSRNATLLSLLSIVALLSAGVMYGMFSVGTFSEFEKSRLYFAAAVLAFLAFIFMLSMIFYAFGPEPSNGTTESAGKSIFDSCVKVIPPIVTLVIGFYFGASPNRGESDRSPPNIAQAAPASAVSK
jgi:hypothetical protein